MLRDASSTWGAASLPVLTSPGQGAPSASERPASRRAPLALAAMGLGLALSLAATGLAVSVSPDKPADAVPANAASVVRAAPAAADPPPGPGRIVLNGPGNVAVVKVVYEAGQSSGWHAHAGIHAVAVVSGELTVYGNDCTPLRVVPGQPYIGGQELHMTRNETGQPVEMIVTYLNPATASGDPGPKPAPANCTVA